MPGSFRVPQRARRWGFLLALLPAGAWAADPQITSMVDNPDPVTAGGLYTYAVGIDNTAVSASTNTVLTMAVPSGATFDSASPADANCVATSATVVTCNIGALPGNGNGARTINFTWRALGPGPATITGTATITSDNDTNLSNNSQNATTTVNSGADLRLTKTDSPDPVIGGANVTYTLTATNDGPNASGNLVLTDSLPGSSTFVSASGPGWSCSHTAGLVTCTRNGPLAVGASAPAVTVVARVDATGGFITNSATINPAAGATPDPVTANNTATATTQVLPGADVRVDSKTVAPNPVIAGDTATFTIAPRNGGPAIANNVVVTDTLPAGWTFVSATGTGWSCSASGQTVTCSRATYAVGGTNNITLVATAPGNAVVGPTGTNYTNTASISTSDNDPNTGNNSSGVTFNVLPDGADLRLTKSKSPNPVAQGSQVTSTINVTNNGPRRATGPLRVVDQLSGETYVSASGTGWTCSVSGNTVTCDHPNAAGLNANASLPTLSIITTATVAGSATNEACTGSSLPAGASGATARQPIEGDPNPTNDCSSQSANSTSTRPDLAIAKTTSTPTGGDKVVSGTEDSVTYTLVVTNASGTPENATGVRIVDTVPAFISSGANATQFDPVVPVVSAGSTATFSCSRSGATITCNQTGGVLAQGETVTVPITVKRGMTDGAFTNTATVTNTQEGDPNSANNTASDTVTIVPMADMQMTGKTIEPATTKAGQVATYVLSFRNNGPSIAADVVVTDVFTFPAGDPGFTVTQITSSKPGSSCAVSGGNPGGVAAGDVLDGARNSFTCRIGSMSNGETQAVTLKGRPNFKAGNLSRVFTNIASVTTSTAEKADGTDGGNNSQGPVTLNVGPAELDLLVNKTDTGFDPVAYETGNTFLSYRVNVTNNAGSYATGAKVTETITPPAGKRIRFVCDTTTFGGSTCNAPSLCSTTNITSGAGTALPDFTCDVPAGDATTGPARGDLAVTQTKSVFLRFEVLDNPEPTGDIFTNRAVASANEPDTFAANDSDEETSTVRRRVNLGITKAAKKAGVDVTTVALREPFVWEMVVSNAGPGDSLQTIVTDTLAAGTEVIGDPATAITWTKTAPAATGSCAYVVATRAITCTMGQLDNGGSITITAPVRITAYPSGGTQNNSATVNTDPANIGGIDTTPGDNTASDSVTVTRSSIAGTVFQDRIRDGANGGTPQAAGNGVGQEPRIQGVTLRITGTDLYGNAVNTTTTTDASGNFTFNDLSPSDATGYLVTQTQPAGFINGTVDPPAAGADAPSNGGTYARPDTSGNSTYTGIVLDGATAAVRYNFPEIKQPTLSGFVYLDKNANDVRDPATDTGISGATVRLLRDDTLAQVATTTTAADGAYSFTGLDPLVVYTLEEPLPTTPANLRNGAANAGQIGGAACASGCVVQQNTPVADTDRIASIDLGSGADGTVFNFGERQLASISGLVYVDKNRNNALDGTDTVRLAGVTVRLVQGATCAAGTELQTTTTAADGTYSFSGVLAFQNYLVCETQPVGYGIGNANGTAGSNQITLTNLAATGSANNNFGALVASLAGSVYQDTGAGTAANFNNGVRDAGEPGIAGVTVTLTGTDSAGGAVNRTATTDASGNYLFDDLLAPGAGGYTVTEGAIPPSAGTFLDGKTTAGGAGGTATAVNTLPSAISSIALGAGVQTTGYIFGELPNGSITGTVYIDRNRNNALDAVPTDGRIQGVTLTLRDGTSCSAGTARGTTTTDANGQYAFSDVPGGGAYTVCETQPTGYADGTVNAGTNGASSAANSITITNLPSSGSANNNFGERVGSLAGSVYVDFSAATPANTNNGIRDAGEAGIAGVTVTLTGTDAAGGAVNRTATTDTNGNYAFDDLLAGTYTVTEGAIPPAAGSFNDGKTTAGAAGGTATAVNTLPSAISAITLGAGVQATGYIFGELPRAGISGTVYVDRNRNDTIDPTPTDGRVAGVTLTLREGTSCSAGTVLGTATTGADGTYAFNDLSAGLDYAVCETQPTGYESGATNPGTNGASSASNSIAITNLPTTGSANNNFGERVGSLAGSVYQDTGAGTAANFNNGIRDAGEAGIAGVTITLTGTDAAGGAVNRTATTDTNGNYAFDDLLGGTYTVTEGAIPPSAGTFLDGKTTAGAAGGTATAVNTLPSAISAITLGAGVQTTGYIFGELPNGSISGTVYIDRNRNDIIDPTPTDGRVAGVTLTLREGTSCSAGTVLGTTTTAADGTYTFGGIAGGGTYTICETQPTGYASGATNPGTNGASGGTNAITITNLPSTGSADNNFGERVGSLAGSVYMDTNNDGQKQAGEPGLASVVVTLTGTDATGAAINRTATTDAAGAYRFDDLLAAGAGGYTVTEQATQPTFEGKPTINGRTTAGSTGGSATAVTTLPSAISAIPLAAGADSTAHLFGELLSVGLSGTVFADLANDGVQQLPNDLGLAGVTLDLTGTDDLGAAVSATTTTAADGTYSFTGLRPGTYTVTEPTQPAGTVNGITTAGSTGGTATPVATLPSVISAIPLVTSGAFSTGNNFAEIPNNSGIGGRVWLDLDNDGVIDAGESGIAGVTVTLTGTDTIGRPVERTLTTDAQGGYLFEQLAPGSYTVTEPTQPAGTLNGRTVAGNGGGAATPVATLPSAISGITLGIGQMVTANNFGEIPPARLAGRVYADNNDNGTIDNGETGLAGVALVLTGTDDLGAAVTANATTGADGSYSFTGLRPGTYTITEPTQPAGTVNGITTAGSLGGTATPVATVPSAISGVVLPVGGAGTDYNFGELSLSPDLRVTKGHAEPIFTVTKPATYTIRVRNAGNAPTSGAYTVDDRLPAGLTLTATPTGNGWTCTGAVGASAFSCTSSTVIAAGATNANAITAVAVVGTAALNAPVANNAVLVDGGGEIPARRPTPAERDAFNNNPAALPECSADIVHNACRDPEDVQQAANLSGTVWYDIGTVQRQLDARDLPKQGWIVEVIDINGVDPSRPNAVTGERESLTGAAAAAAASADAKPAAGGTPGAVVARAFTKADGTYLIENLIPNVDYGIRFRDPNSNVVFGYPVNGERGPGSSGANCLALNKPVNLESSCVETGATPQLAVRLAPGRNLVQQSLPIDPSGVVYDSGLRTPVPGATVTLTPVGACAAWDPADDIVGATLGGYRIAGNAISMVTGGDGLYQFLLSPGAPARCTFALTVTPPSGYTFESKLIAPTPGPLAPPGGPGSYFNVQPQAEAPTGPVGTATTYYLSLVSGSAAPNILRNHIPLDPALPGAVLLDKTGDRSVVEVGDSVRYSITVSVPSGALPRQTTIVDRLPAGFTYIPGTATVDDRRIADPQGGVGPTLAFNLGPMGATRQLVLRYRVRVGVGAQEGDGVNRAQAQACGVPTGCVDAGFNPLPGSVATNEDRYRVRVTGGVFGTEACVLGKVFVDCNNNHVQDPEEIGIPGVRFVMSDGTTLISDSEGKYSVCGLEPKSTVMRVDPRTLPQGARMTTSSNRNLGDAGSLWLDLKNGELHRADFVEGSCSAPVIDQVKGRRAQGEIRAPETERKDGPALRFESEGPYIGPVQPREAERATPANPEQKGGAHGTP